MRLFFVWGYDGVGWVVDVKKRWIEEAQREQKGGDEGGRGGCVCVCAGAR